MLAEHNDREQTAYSERCSGEEEHCYNCNLCDVSLSKGRAGTLTYCFHCNAILLHLFCKSLGLNSQRTSHLSLSMLRFHDLMHCVCILDHHLVGRYLYAIE